MLHPWPGEPAALLLQAREHLPPVLKLTPPLNKALISQNLNAYIIFKHQHIRTLKDPADFMSSYTYSGFL